MNRILKYILDIDLISSCLRQLRFDRTKGARTSGYLWRSGSFAFVCFASLLCSCGNRHTGETITLSDLPVINIPMEPDSFIEVKNWLAIGPFEFNPRATDPAESFLRNDLRRYGIKEGLINETEVEKLQRRNVGAFLINELSPQIKLFEYIRDRIERKSNLYLVARINSAEAQDATLIMDGSNSYAAWLNGNKQVEVRAKYNTNKKGDRFVNISLKEGENTLFVKVNRSSNLKSWDFICAIASREEGERMFKVNYHGDFVVNPIVNDSFEVYAGPYSNGEIEVRDEQEQIVTSNSFGNMNTNYKPFVVSGLNGLKEGFYKTILTVGGERIEEMIYKGDYSKFVEQAKANVAKIDGSTPYTEDLRMAMQRVIFLNDKPGDPNSPSETRFLNRNRVFWGYSLHGMLNNTVPSTQLMTYNDEDNSTGVFIFHNGTELKHDIPLVVLVPYALEGDSILEDWYTSNLDQIEGDNSLADQYGLTVAWLYAGGKNYSADKTRKEIAAVINRLNSEYDIDDQKMFIMGDCEGGRRALVQLATSSAKYSACALIFPITLSGGDDGIVPINLISQMNNTPMIIKHGTNDEISPVENSRRFVSEAQKIDLSVEYIENEDSHTYINRDNRRFAFEFFGKIAQDK